MREHFIYPHELALMLLFYALPVWIICGILQWRYLRKRGASKKQNFFALTGMLVLSILLAIAAFLIIPGEWIPHWLRIINLNLLGMYFSQSPVFIMVITIASLCITHCVAKNITREALNYRMEV